MSEHDNLSTFIRKALRRPNIDFDEGDWGKLEKMLDANSEKATSGGYRRKTSAVAVVALLFLSTGAYYFFTPDHQQNASGNESLSVHDKTEDKFATADSNTDVQSQNTKATEKTTELQSVAKNENESLTESRSEAVTQSRVDHSAKAQKIATKQNVPTQDKQLTLSNDVNTYAQNENAVEDTQKQNNKIEELPKDKNDFSAQIENPNQYAANSSTAQTDATARKEATDHSAKGLMSKSTTTSSLPEDSLKELSQQNDSSVAQLKKTKKISPADSLPADQTPARLSRWSVLLTYAPEFSSAGLHKFTSPGDAFGIVGYYHLNKALSFSLGVIKSCKTYWDDGSNYKPAQDGYWAKKTNGIVPSKIDGTCSLLEIPLGVQYYISQKPRSKMYVAASFSSYVMLDESYQYTFDAPNPGAVDNWSARKPSSSMFNIAGFSAGYERNISPQLAIGVSPYIKIPIDGVGVWANVKLYSMGAAFTMRYRFQKRKQAQQLSPARSPD